MEHRVQMIDTRAWEEDGLLTYRGPSEPEERWLPFAAGYEVEHVAANVVTEEGYHDVVALIPGDDRLPALYYLITEQTLTKLQPLGGGSAAQQGWNTTEVA